MRGSTHMAVGMAAGALICQQFNLQPFEPVVIVLGLSVFGSVLPDIDHPESWISRRLWFASWMVHPFLSHRGLTHSALALLLIFIGWGMAMTSPEIPIRFEWVHGLALLGGYASHLVADLLTPQGVRLLYPLPGRWRLVPDLAFFETGGLLDGIVGIACIFASIWLLNRL